MRLVSLAVVVVAFDCCNLDERVTVVRIAAAAVVDVVVEVVDDRSISVSPMIHLNNGPNQTTFLAEKNQMLTIWRRIPLLLLLLLLLMLW